MAMATEQAKAATPLEMVWILETGQWDESEILGVFATPQAALAAAGPDLQKVGLDDQGEAVWSDKKGYGARIRRHAVQRISDDLSVFLHEAFHRELLRPPPRGTFVEGTGVPPPRQGFFTPPGPEPAPH